MTPRRFIPGARVRVVCAIEPEIHDVRPYIGQTGTRDWLHGDEAPLVGVVLDSGAREDFFPEELEAA